MQAGACDFVEKPLIDDNLLSVVENALACKADPDATNVIAKGAAPPEAHAVARWANAVVGVIDSRCDPNTFEAWGRCVASSPGTLKNWCRIAGFSPKRSLMLARLLRAVVRHHIDGYRPCDCLNVVDGDVPIAVEI